MLAAALLTLGADGVDYLETGEATWRSLEDIWALVHSNSLDQVRGNEAVPAAVRDQVLALPSWAILGGLGIIFAALFRRRD